MAWVVSLPLAVGAAIGWVSVLLPIVLASGGLLVYLLRHRRFLDELRRADAALDRGDVDAARRMVGPLLERYPELAPVQKTAADVLYSGGDPLSAAALYERVARRWTRPDVVTGLVASYAALNKIGDARRASALAPEAIDVRLAHAWAELVALGGDRSRGRALTSGLYVDLDRAAGLERNAMLTALIAIGAASTGDRAGVDAAIDRLAEHVAAIAPHDAAFIGYLEGVALREAGSLALAKEAFGRAMERGPASIGHALARRERSHLPPTDGGQASESGSSVSQPSSDWSSSA